MKKLILSSLLLSPNIAFATLISFNFQLTGDMRVNNPNNLLVNVSILSDTTSNIASWEIQLDSTAHPNVKLDEFYFNLGGLPSDYVFSTLSPFDWKVESPGDPKGGGFGTEEFMFSIVPTKGNSTTINDSVLLAFDMELSSGFFTKDMFLFAYTVSGDAGIGQLGAHLQSLDTFGCSGCSDSGFALGMYGDYYNGEYSPNAVPEPGALVLMSVGLLGLYGMRKGN